MEKFFLINFCPTNLFRILCKQAENVSRDSTAECEDAQSYHNILIKLSQKELLL